jgi:hypothetical protein
MVSPLGRVAGTVVDEEEEGQVRSRGGGSSGSQTRRIAKVHNANACTEAGEMTNFQHYFPMLRHTIIHSDQNCDLTNS